MMSNPAIVNEMYNILGRVVRHITDEKDSNKKKKSEKGGVKNECSN